MVGNAIWNIGFSVLFVLGAMLSQAQYWMQKGGGLTVDEAYDIAVDASGNTYTTGYFTGTATFAPTNLVSSGSTDIFVVKHDNQGVMQWAVKAGGNGADRGLSIKIDGSGNVYVTGYFNGTASFATETVVSAGLQDVFIAKYNNSGTLQWVESAGGTDADIGNGITVDGSGNVIVTGEFKGTATFGSVSLTSTNGTTDVFITKLSSSGSFSWTQQGAGGDTDRGIDVSSDNAGNIYAIGQFSNTITFDVAHSNTMFNVVFVVKFDGTGAEQWFKIIGGASSNIANSIVTDGSGNSYITGDFSGTLTLYGSPNTTLSSAYSDKIFVAKYSSTGSVSWATASGSDNDVTSRAIAIDGSGNSYISGHFKCSFDGFSDVYGSGTFNSVGNHDIFVAKFNSSGAWQYSRNIGGRDEDYGHGVAVYNGNIHFAGSFQETLNFPVSGNFLSSNLANWTDVSCAGNNSYCSDPDYGNYYGFTTAGNSDVVVANCFDPDREPYDFYPRSGAGCQRDQVPVVCINPNCPDSLSACNTLALTAQDFTCPGIGPEYNYSWSSGSPSGPNAFVNSTGTYTVQQISTDGCFTSSDDIYVEINNPARPTISDDVVVNTATQFPVPINVCAPATITLTGGGFGTNDYKWTGPSLGPNGVVAVDLTVTSGGTYTFNVTDPNGCTSSTSVLVVMHDPLPPFDLEYFADDTIQICDGEPATIWLYDAIGNPGAAQECLDLLGYLVNTNWTIVPNTPNMVACETFLYLNATDTGYYNFDVTLVRENPCNSDTHTLSATVYIEVLPSPSAANYSLQLDGSTYFCPGDSTLLVASGAINYLWFGPGYAGYPSDSIWVSVPGIYNVSCSVSDTNQYGCTATYSEQSMIIMEEKPQPLVTAASLIICPNDSVQLYCSNAGTFGQNFYWEGPNGPLQGNGPIINVSDPGSYYCIVQDEDSCNLLSNTITLAQYTTPALSVGGDPVICENDSMVISVVANENSIIEWQNPFGDSTQSVTVYGPGTYTCKITSCGIVSYVSIDVVASDVFAEITSGGPLCIGKTTTLHGNGGMMAYEWSPGGQTAQDITISGEGTYTLTTTDSNGCTAVSEPFTVVIDQVPTVIGLDGYTTFCEGDSVELVGNADMVNYLWSPTGDTTETIIVYDPGTYELSTLDTNGCEGKSKPVELFNPSTYAPLEVVGDTAFCEGNFVVLNSLGTGLETAIWSPESDTGFSTAVFLSGNYSLVTIDTFGCLAWSDTVAVNVQPNDLTDPAAFDTLICAGESVLLTASSGKGIIQWYDEVAGEVVATGNELFLEEVLSNITFRVYSELMFCRSGSSPVNVWTEDCESITIPNVITPNGDGSNDFFTPKLIGHTCFHGKIFNRWGRLVYEMDMANDSWDGTVASTGEPVSDGTYFYIIEFCRHDDVVKEHRGTVTVLRNGTD